MKLTILVLLFSFPAFADSMPTIHHSGIVSSAVHETPTIGTKNAGTANNVPKMAKMDTCPKNWTLECSNSKCVCLPF